MGKKIAIIGAGVSGLAAGIYALKAGYKVEIFEKHKLPGGEMTGWDREGYHIDGCIHWLTGTADDPDDSFNSLWKDTGVLGVGVRVIKPETFGTFTLGGDTFSFYRDIERTRARMFELSPDDEPAIDAFINDVKTFPYVSAPAVAVDCLNLAEKMKLGKTMMPAYNTIKKFKIPVNDYAEKFTNPLLRFAFKSWGLGNKVISEFLYSYSTAVNDKTGVPEGGSRAAALRMADKFTSAGGRIYYGVPAAKIPVVNRTASVIMADETWLNADYIIPACDTHSSLNMLHTRYRDKKIEERDDDPETYPLFQSVLFAYSVDDDMKNAPAELTFRTQMMIGDSAINTLSYKTYPDFPEFAPSGKNVMQVNVPAEYGFWDKLYADKKNYLETKKRYGNEILQRIEENVPALRGKLRLIDAATPKTWERYTGAYKGAWMSWGATPKSKSLLHSGRVPGIDNLFLAGQWLAPPGGLPSAITGKWAVQRIMKRDKLDYRNL